LDTNLKNYKSWLDENTLLHHVNNPTEQSSENEILFTAEYVLLRRLLGKECYFPFLGYAFYMEEWQDGKHMSHDNRTGILAIDSDHYPLYKLANRTWLHPRDLVFWGYKKHPRLFWPLLPIVCISNIISCAKTYKTHKDGRKELTTSGKMLAFVRNKSSNLELTHKVCTWFIRRNKHFGSWTKVSKIYFPNKGHPIPILMSEWEQTA